MLSWKIDDIMGTLLVHENEGVFVWSYWPFHLNVIFYYIFYGERISIRKSIQPLPEGIVVDFINQNLYGNKLKEFFHIQHLFIEHLEIGHGVLIFSSEIMKNFVVLFLARMFVCKERGEFKVEITKTMVSCSCGFTKCFWKNFTHSIIVLCIRSTMFFIFCVCSQEFMNSL